MTHDRGELERLRTTLDKLLACSGARGRYHAMEYAEAVKEAEAALSAPAGDARAMALEEAARPVPFELSEFASVLADEVIGRVRNLLEQGKPLSIEDQKLLIEQCVKDRKRASLSSPGRTELEQALRPFAEACTISTASDDSNIDNSIAAAKITFGHLRRAREAIRALTLPDGKGQAA